MKFKVLLIVSFLMIVSVAAIPFKGESAQYQDIFGKTQHINFNTGTDPQNVSYIPFSMLAGDNITIRVWNFTGPSGAELRVALGMTDYNEKDANFSTDLIFTQSTTGLNSGTVFNLWAIIPYDCHNGLSVGIYNSGYSLLYSLDIFINRSTSRYTPDYGVPGFIDNATKDIRSNITLLQNQMSSLSQQVNQMNTTLNQVLNNQTNIWNNLTNVKAQYDLLNQSLMNLTNQFDLLNQSLLSLNMTSSNLTENITHIQDTISNINSDIYDIQYSIEQLSTNQTDLSGLQDQINSTLAQINRLQENITDLWKDMPDEYNDTTLLNKIIGLEVENALLRKDIADLQNETPEKNDEKKEKNNDSLAYAGIAVGAIGLMIGLVAVAMLLSRPRPVVIEKVRERQPKRKKPDFVDADEEELEEEEG